MLQDYRNILHFFLLFQILLYPQRRQMIWRDHLKQRDRFQTTMTWMDRHLVENREQFAWTINVNPNFILHVWIDSETFSFLKDLMGGNCLDLLVQRINKKYVLLIVGMLIYEQGVLVKSSNIEWQWNLETMQHCWEFK